MATKNIVILTGAGISAESGVPTFRDGGGLWTNYRVEEIASPDAFERNPVLVHEFYNMRRKQLLAEVVDPNPAHEALARLEKEYQGETDVITQNVDNLHERAGSRRVFHMHGDLLQSRCHYCSRLQECLSDLSTEDRCPSCGKKGGMRPNVVWFGEMPLYMNEIEKMLMKAGIFIAIGTSGVVYPAAGFAAIAKDYGAETIEINVEPTEISGLFDRTMAGRASLETPRLVEEILEKHQDRQNE